MTKNLLLIVFNNTMFTCYHFSIRTIVSIIKKGLA